MVFRGASSQYVNILFFNDRLDIPVKAVFSIIFCVCYKSTAMIHAWYHHHYMAVIWNMSHHARTLDTGYARTLWGDLQAPRLLMTCYVQEKSPFLLSVDLANLFHKRCYFIICMESHIAVLVNKHFLSNIVPRYFSVL